MRVRLRATVSAWMFLRFVLTPHSTVDFGGGEGVGRWVCVRVCGCEILR